MKLENSMPFVETIPWHVILENSMPLFETIQWHVIFENTMPLFETIPWHVILENSMPLFETIPWHVILEISMPLFETILWHLILENYMSLFATGTRYVDGLAPERKILISFLLLKFYIFFLLLIDPYQHNVHLPYFPLFLYLKDWSFINLLSS